MAAPIPRKLKKGELLFNEGDISKSMYFVQTGTIRLFKKKGNASIELGMIHKGEVIGEMGFLDGGPRSASAEAIHDTDLMEITNANLVEQLKVCPPWLMVLLKTIVNRLRSANNKIRQLESVSTSYTYGSEGVSQSYQYLNAYDVMKIGTSVLVSASRGAEVAPDGTVKIPMARIQKYANNIMGLHVSKITEFLDILERVGLAKIDRSKPDKIEIYLTDVDQIELFVNFVNDDNLKEHSKKTVFSAKSLIIMAYMVKHIELFPANAEGVAEVNIAKIIALEKEANGGKEPFKLDDTFAELVKCKLCTELALKDGNTIITKLTPKSLIRMYRIQKIIKEVDAINEKKREQAARTASSHR